MNKIIFTAVLGLFFCSIFADTHTVTTDETPDSRSTSVYGTIRDSYDFTAIRGATVRILNSSTLTRSKSDGSFSITTDSFLKKCTLVFSAENYSSDTVTVNLFGPKIQIHPISLKNSLQAMDLESTVKNRNKP